MEAWQRVQVDQRQDARSVISGFAVEFYLWVEMSLAKPEVLERRPLTRCGWATSDPLYIRYHDEEWGVPVHDDRHFFEMLILEGAQAGLSWITILRKRAAYRKAFDRFDPKKVAKYDARKRRTLLADAGIVRNRAKIDAAIGNARAFLDIQRRVRQLRCLRLAIRRRPPNREPAANACRGPAADDGVRRTQPRPASTRLQVRGIDHLLCVHASNRPRRRSPDDLFPEKAKGMKKKSSRS